MAEEKKIEAQKEIKAPETLTGSGTGKQKKKFRIFSSLILIFSILLLLITLLVSVTQTLYFMDFIIYYLVDMFNEDFAIK